MKDGFIKAAAGTPKVQVAGCRENAEQTFGLMRQADALGVHLLVLPELGLTGCTCGDLFFQPTLLDGAAQALSTVLEATRNLGLITVVGLPLRHNHRVYNCAAVLQGGKVLGVVPKRCGGFLSQTKHFAPPPEGVEEISLPTGQVAPFGAGLIFACGNLPAFSFGVVLGDLVFSPESSRLSFGGGVILANPGADCALVGKRGKRLTQIASESARLSCGIVSAEAGDGESTTDLVFAGHNVIGENGAILSESRFDTGLSISEIDVNRLASDRRRKGAFQEQDAPRATVSFSLPLTKTSLTRYISALPFVPEDGSERSTRCEEILLIASLGLKKRLEHTGAKTAVIGLSGGLDSTLAILITMIAMKMMDRPAEDIIAVTMPCFGTTDRTRNNAVELAERCGATLRRIDISNTVRSHFTDIGQSMDKHDVTFENAQARERTQVLMDIANQTEGMVIGTGDLSELALGWATYNGDHMSMYSVNASIPKTLVRHLVQYVSKDKAQEDRALSVVLSDILDTPVSPELLPAVGGVISQRTEDLVGPYELHDFFLYYIVRWAFPPKKVLRLAEHTFGRQYPRDVILKWLRTFYRRFFSQQFKRSCLPDGPKIGSVSLSPRGDWQMPSDAVSALWLAELSELE